jgi:ribosomal subunit interface protein
MIKPVQVVFHGVEHSAAVQEHVRDEVAKLERLHPRVSRCRVTVGLPHNRQQQGKLFDVHVELAVPGKALIVNRALGQEDMYAALRDAFDAAKRQLDDHARSAARSSTTRKGRLDAYGQTSSSAMARSPFVLGA